MRGDPARQCLQHGGAAGQHGETTAKARQELTAQEAVWWSARTHLERPGVRTAAPPRPQGEQRAGRCSLLRLAAAAWVAAACPAARWGCRWGARPARRGPCVACRGGHRAGGWPRGASWAGAAAASSWAPRQACRAGACLAAALRGRRAASSCLAGAPCPGARRAAGLGRGRGGPGEACLVGRGRAAPAAPCPCQAEAGRHSQAGARVGIPLGGLAGRWAASGQAEGTGLVEGTGQAEGRPWERSPAVGSPVVGSPAGRPSEGLACRPCGLRARQAHHGADQHDDVVEIRGHRLCRACTTRHAARERVRARMTHRQARPARCSSPRLRGTQSCAAVSASRDVCEPCAP